MRVLHSSSAQETRAIGEVLGSIFVAGDLVLVHGELGAGKTTLTQGMAQGLKVTGRVVSPTFIVSRTHESSVGGPPLVHVDAYRIEDDLDLETLDLDTSLPESVTVVEWGAKKAEVLSDERLEIRLHALQTPGADWLSNTDEVRRIELLPIGETWDRRLEAAEADFAALEDL